MSFKVLVGTPITAAMVTSSTVAEPAAGETAWVSGGTVSLGDVRIRSTTNRKYEALIGHTGRAVLPEVDPTYWLDIGPTNKHAPFDTTISTACSVVTPCTYVLRPGFFNCIRFYGLNGARVQGSIKDAPAGTVFKTFDVDLLEPPLDYYDWAFGVLKQLKKLGITDILPYPDPEVTITITAAPGVTVGVGMIVIGDYRDLLPDAEYGGTLPGASAEPVNFSDISQNKYGELTIIDGRKATDMRFKVVMPFSNADYFLESIQEVLSSPAAIVADDTPGTSGLDVMGLVTGSMSYDNKGGTATFNGYAKGII